MCLVRKDDDDDDDGRSLLAERRNRAKDQNGKKEREKETRARDVKEEKSGVLLSLYYSYLFYETF